MFGLLWFCLFSLTRGNICLVCGSYVDDAGDWALASEFLNVNVLPDRLAGAEIELKLRTQILDMQICIHNKIVQDW